MYFVKIDSVGNEEWNQTVGGVENEVGTDVVYLPDEGYYAAGYSNSYGTGSYDAYLVRLEGDSARLFGNQKGVLTAGTYIIAGETMGIWEYIHEKRTTFKQYSVYGYAYVPPTPFLLKDWERYDVSRYVDPGCISPEEGWRSISVPDNVVKNTTIQKDLEQLVPEDDLLHAIFLFHTPPYRTKIDRAGLDGKTIDHTPVDVHVGSIAVKPAYLPNTSNTKNLSCDPADVLKLLVIIIVRVTQVLNPIQ